MGLAAFIAARFSPSLNLPCRLRGSDGANMESAALGRLGERIAGAYLRAQGAKLLYRNFKAPRGGEVDIVAREGKLLVFAEVKTRRAGGMGRPLDAVDREKQRLIERGANEWLRQLGRRDIPWRFDVIEVILTHGKKPEIRRVENVF